MDTAPPTATLPVVNRVVETPKKSRSITLRPLHLGIGALVLALIAGGAYFAVGLGGSSYQSSAKDLLAVVLSDNVVIKSKVEALGPGTSPVSLQTSVAAAINDAADATNGLVTLSNPDAATELDLRSALSAETTWLRTLLGVLKQPVVAPAVPLPLARDSVANAFARLSFLGTPQFPNVSNITVWVASLRQDASFVLEVQSILQQSATILPTLNYFYSQLHEAANYGDASISLYEAESDIQRIIDSRQMALNRTQGIVTSDPVTANIQTLLANAFTASLKDDNDLYNCLYQYSNGWTTYIAQSCLDASQPDNLAATNAKQSFRATYNALRAQLGIPPFAGSF